MGGLAEVGFQGDPGVKATRRHQEQVSHGTSGEPSNGGAWHMLLVLPGWCATPCVYWLGCTA